MDTHVDFVFAISDSDVVEQRGFIQVHQRTWDTNTETINNNSKKQKQTNQKNETELTVVLHMFIDVIFGRKHLVDGSQESLREKKRKLKLKWTMATMIMDMDMRHFCWNHHFTETFHFYFCSYSKENFKDLLNPTSTTFIKEPSLWTQAGLWRWMRNLRSCRKESSW